MNDPSFAVSSEDTAQTSADHGRAENLVQETITRFGIWTPRWHLASPRRALLFTGFAWLSIAVIAPRFTRAPVTTDVLAFLAAAVAGFPAHRVAGRSEQGARAAAAAGAAGPTRYSPAGAPPLVTASTRNGRIELRVIDCGPGVPEADRDRMFAPFQRLGNTDSTTGIGLGLAVSRGLTEAMRGTLQPAQTPGGGLTMTMSLIHGSRITCLAGAQVSGTSTTSSCTVSALVCHGSRGLS
jgi:hypothetical protein